jgi:hypothetical protein
MDAIQRYLAQELRDRRTARIVCKFLNLWKADLNHVISNLRMTALFGYTYFAMKILRMNKSPNHTIAAMNTIARPE